MLLLKFSFYIASVISLISYGFYPRKFMAKLRENFYNFEILHNYIIISIKYYIIYYDKFKPFPTKSSYTVCN